MALASASPRFREQIEALVLAICDILGCAAPDGPALDTIIRQEAAFLNSSAGMATPVFDPGTVTRVVAAVTRWRTQEAVAIGPAPAGGDPPEGPDG